MVPLKYLGNFWKTLEISLINCEINLILILSANCFIINDPVNNQIPKLELTNIKLDVLIVNLSTQDNTRLLEDLKSGFKRTKQLE